MIIDFHTHIFPPWLIENRDKYLSQDVTFSELYKDPNAKMATAEDLVESMRKYSVTTSVVMGIGWSDYGLASEVNDYIIESVKLFPNQLVGFCGVNPNWGKKAIQEVDRCATSGLSGVGEFHPDSQSFSIDDYSIMAPLVEVIQQNGFIVTTHSSEPVGHQYPGKGNIKPEILWKFLQNFPELTVVCAHWGGGLPFYALMPEVADGLSNVYFDSAASPFLYSESIFPQAVSLVGANRILMGSDFPLINQGRMLRLLEGVDLSDSDKKAILSGNAANLLNLD